MSRLDELIAELCPDGVEYKRLEEVATISRGGSFQKKDFLDSGFPCIHYGQIYTQYGLFADKTLKFISPVVAEKQRKAVKNDVVMAVTSENIDDVCKCLAWLGEDEVAVSGHTAIIHHNQNPKYLTYYFHSEMFAAQKRRLAHGTKVIEVTPDKLNDVKIPLPPLEVQREIVRILDAFTELTAELTAELDARKKQYEYYLDEVLTPKDGCPFVKLSEVCSVGDGLHGTPTYDEFGEYFFINGNNLSNGRIIFDEKTKRVDEDSYKKHGITFGETILMSINGTIGNIAYYTDEKIVLGKSAAYFTVKSPNLLKTYLYYYLQSTTAKLYYETNLTGSTIKNLGLKALRNFKIPLPPLAEQERIVAILDRFDKLCNDITSGIPAEIEARRKQYEHYRDRLLTFKEKTA